MKIIYFLTIGLLLSNINFAQSDDEYVNENFERNYDHVYLNNIKSVKLHFAGLPLNYPIIDLNRGGSLVLSFDDLEGDVKDYNYTLTHCNADWTPSDLTHFDYIDGFSDEVIQNYDYSFNTLTEFTHYKIKLPNQNMRFTKSGNYLLHIYLEDDDNNKVMAITRRFIVSESKFIVSATVQNANSAGKMRTHQEVDFVVNHKGITISNPHLEVKVAILQNGRWDNAIEGLKPLFVQPEKLVYDYQNKIVFPGGQEFRHVDLRTFEFRTDRMRNLFEDKVDGFHVQLYTDESRYTSYVFEQDVNGKFMIENYEARDHDLESDYAWVHFYLKSENLYDAGNIYLLGGMTDWQIQAPFQMKYKEEAKGYYAKVRLKQGYYNYGYALVKGAGATPDLSHFDNNHYQTENDYHILVYYRPFGQRYDRLMAVHYLNSIR